MYSTLPHGSLFQVFHSTQARPTPTAVRRTAYLSLAFPPFYVKHHVSVINTNSQPGLHAFGSARVRIGVLVYVCAPAFFVLILRCYP